MTCTGAQMVVKALEAEGVPVVFGIPGGPIIPLYDALSFKNAYFSSMRTRNCVNALVESPAAFR